jgi:hypothetical protein
MAVKTSYSHARENLATLWDEIEDSREAVVIARRGHEDMALIPAAMSWRACARPRTCSARRRMRCGCSPPLLARAAARQGRSTSPVSAERWERRADSPIAATPTRRHSGGVSR